MAKPSVEELMAVESRLNWSLIASVLSVLAIIGWSLVGNGRGGQVGALCLALIQLACYIWFAVSAGAAARLLGEPRWKYVTWILVAPFLARLPIPIVSTIIGISPLSIKFLLGGQLQTAIRERTLED